MKFEKLNDYQIRCTLTKEDLDNRKLLISELAYGTDKARSLFRDMMEIASNEYDFEAEDYPLMIEAVPISSDAIVLTITKVEDPEELDTRFAKFSPALLSDSDDLNSEDEIPELSSLQDDMVKLFNQLSELKDIALPDDVELTRLFSFGSMDELIKAAKIICSEYTGTSSLYKDAVTSRYVLMITRSSMNLVTFNRICNILSEYGNSEKNYAATDAYLSEHFEMLIKSDAVQKLANI